MRYSVLVNYYGRLTHIIGYLLIFFYENQNILFSLNLCLPLRPSYFCYFYIVFYQEFISFLM